MTDLHTACLEGATEKVAKILAKDTSGVNALVDDVPLLERVCEAGLVEVGLQLVQAGARLDLCSAASLGLTESVRVFLDEDPTAVHTARRLFGYQPVHCAAECGHPETLKLLLDRGALATARNEWGFTPLHLAVIAARDQPPTEGHHACATMLLDAGADLDAVDAQGTTILGLAQDTVGYGREHGYDLEVIERTLALIEERARS